MNIGFTASRNLPRVLVVLQKIGWEHWEHFSIEKPHCGVLQVGNEKILNVPYLKTYIGLCWSRRQGWIKQDVLKTHNYKE